MMREGEQNVADCLLIEKSYEVPKNVSVRSFEQDCALAYCELLWGESCQWAA